MLDFSREVVDAVELQPEGFNQKIFFFNIHLRLIAFNWSLLIGDWRRLLIADWKSSSSFANCAFLRRRLNLAIARYLVKIRAAFSRLETRATFYCDFWSWFPKGLLGFFIHKPAQAHTDFILSDLFSFSLAQTIQRNSRLIHLRGLQLRLIQLADVEYIFSFHSCGLQLRDFLGETQTSFVRSARD